MLTDPGKIGKAGPSQFKLCQTKHVSANSLPLTLAALGTVFPGFRMSWAMVSRCYFCLALCHHYVMSMIVNAILYISYAVDFDEGLANSKPAIAPIPPGLLGKLVPQSEGFRA